MNTLSKKTKSWIKKGKNNYSVYYGIDKNGKKVYVGITNQKIERRLGQHINKGKPFVRLEEIVGGLTKNQARCLEQFIINDSRERNLGFLNIKNSINPKRSIYNEAKRVGKMLYNLLNLGGK